VGFEKNDTLGDPNLASELLFSDGNLRPTGVAEKQKAKHDSAAITGLVLNAQQSTIHE
jgi:hypothetical protein